MGTRHSLLSIIVIKIATTACNHIFMCGVIPNTLHISGCARTYNICFQHIIIVHSRHCLCYKEKRPIWRITFLQSSPSHETFRGKVETSADYWKLLLFMVLSCHNENKIPQNYGCSDFKHSVNSCYFLSGSVFSER